MTRRPWLSKVAEVLRSPEKDLRKLAAIGEMDPATLFIGTSMDGVDICGQDLRGIRFTHLDLAKVQHDAGTLLDGDKSKAFKSASIFLAVEGVGDRSIARLIGDQTFLNLMGDEESFLKIADARRPTIIVAVAKTLGLAEFLVREARARGCEPLVILAERSRRRDGTPAFTALDEFGRILRVLPPTSFRMAPGPDTLVGEVRDALSFAVAEWPNLEDHFQDKRSLLFMRAKGVGERPSLDGCAQLAERWWREGAPGLPKVLALRDTTAPRDFGSALLKAETVTRLSDLISPAAFNCAMLVQLGPPPLDAGDFVDRVHTAAQLASKSRQPFSDWYKSAGGERLSMVGDDFGRPRRPPTLPPPDVRRFDFEDVRSVVLSDQAEISRVVEHLMHHHELLVSPRDILAAPADGHKLWVLVAAQMRRLMRSTHTEHRQAYLEMLVREALRMSPSQLRDVDGWEGILADPSFSYRYRLSMSRLLVEPRETRCHLRLEGRGGNGNVRLTEAILIVDEEGPLLLDPRGFRRAHRAPAQGAASAA